jgi:hypothetical protein
MNCPNCVLGDLHFVVRGELRFQTDGQGRPCGTAEIQNTGEQFWMHCDTCGATFGVQSWGADGAGRAILSDVEAPIEMEPKTPPRRMPGGE